VSFEEGWPMRPATDGDLVVLTLADDWWMGDGGMGDSGWGHGGGKTLDEGDGQVALVALDLARGQELWRLDLQGDMLSAPQFAGDGSRLYLSGHGATYHELHNPSSAGGETDCCRAVPAGNPGLSCESCDTWHPSRTPENTAAITVTVHRHGRGHG
jgi:hypothetical protein